ncbi:hypothetical protein [Sorangium sp. So ce131]|uniref:hypothetical protein n=1 Tax=Sorangium sp. So ce131 TaxID=3133282 RepID=UPI003F62FF79
MKRHSILAAGWLLALVGAGCDVDWGPPWGDEEPTDRVWCSVKKTQCQDWIPNQDGIPVACLSVERDANGFTVLHPQSPEGKGQSVCFDPAEMTPEQACERECNWLNPVMNPVVTNSQGFPVDQPRCEAVVLDDPANPNDGVQPGECTASSGQPLEFDPAIPGAPSSPDFYGDLAGSGSLEIAGSTQLVQVEGGSISLKTPDPTCASSPPGQCRVRVNALEVRYENFSFEGHSIEDLKVFLAGPVDSLALPIGGTTQVAFEMLSGTVLNATGRVDGERATLSVQTTSAVTGTYDWESGAITLSMSFGGTVAGQSVSGTALATTSVVGNRPPIAVAGEDQTVTAVDSCEATVALDGSATTDADGNLSAITWSTDSATLGSGPSIVASLPIGEHRVKLSAFDAAGAYTYDSLVVTVVDETLPEFVSPAAEVDVRSCEPGASAVTLEAPQAVNPCNGGAPAVTGRVVSVNGAPASIPVVDGRASLPAGTSVVEWTATNDNGAVTFAQQVHVASEPTLFATRSLTLGDRVEVAADGGVRGSAMSVGNLPTTLRNDVRLGDVFSLPAITVMDRASLASLHHGGPFQLGNQVSIGAIVADADFARPQLPALPAIGSGPGVLLEPNQTQAIAQGSYGNVVVKSRAKLTLAPGVTTMERLELSPQAQIIVPDDGSAQLFVRDQLVFQGSVTRVAGAAGATVPAPLYLGFAGAEARLSADFWGVVVAPNGRLLIETASSPSSPSARGRFYAQSLDVQAGVRLTHDDVFCQ